MKPPAVRLVVEITEQDMRDQQIHAWAKAEAAKLGVELTVIPCGETAVRFRPEAKA